MKYQILAQKPESEMIDFLISFYNDDWTEDTIMEVSKGHYEVKLDGELPWEGLRIYHYEGDFEEYIRPNFFESIIIRNPYVVNLVGRVKTNSLQLASESLDEIKDKLTVCFSKIRNSVEELLG